MQVGRIQGEDVLALVLTPLNFGKLGESVRSFVS